MAISLRSDHPRKLIRREFGVICHLWIVLIDQGVRYLSLSDYIKIMYGYVRHLQDQDIGKLDFPFEDDLLIQLFEKILELGFKKRFFLILSENENPDDVYIFMDTSQDFIRDCLKLSNFTQYEIDCIRLSATDTYADLSETQRVVRIRGRSQLVLVH